MYSWQKCYSKWGLEEAQILKNYTKSNAVLISQKSNTNTVIEESTTPVSQILAHREELCWKLVEDFNTMEHTQVLIIFLTSLEWQIINRERVGMPKMPTSWFPIVLFSMGIQHGPVCCTQNHPKPCIHCLGSWTETPNTLMFEERMVIMEVLLYADEFYLRRHNGNLFC